MPASLLDQGKWSREKAYLFGLVDANAKDDPGWSRYMIGRSHQWGPCEGAYLLGCIIGVMLGADGGVYIDTDAILVPYPISLVGQALDK